MIRLASVFCGDVVVQRRKRIALWGKCAPDSLVRATLGGKESFCISSTSGRFFTYHPPLESGGPETLTVENLTTGESLKLSSVWIGEVWFSCGQSNSAVRLENTIRQDREFRETFPEDCMISILSSETRTSSARQSEQSAQWHRVYPDNAGDMPAAALWFARKLWEELRIPIGIISAAWGASKIESWLSRGMLLRFPDLKQFVEETDRLRSEPGFYPVHRGETLSTETERERFTREFAAFCEKDPGPASSDHSWKMPDFDDSGWIDAKVPGDWIEQGIAGYGAVCFRKTIRIPETWIRHSLRLHLGGIDKHDITSVNGFEVGRSGRSFEVHFMCTKRDYPVPAQIVQTDSLTIAVRVFSFACGAGFRSLPDAYFLENESSGEKISLDGIWRAKVEFDRGIPENPPNPLLPPSFNARSPHVPGTLFDGLIRPLLPYTLSGFLYYQGESDTHNREEASSYGKKLEALIEEWRYLWETPNLPGILIQLADFRTPQRYDPASAWAELRNQQFRTARCMANIHLATALGTGESDDIHPSDKRSVGERAGKLALYNVYGKQNGIPSGPLYRSCRKDGSFLELSFDWSEGGLRTSDGDALRGFVLAGEARIHHPCKAEIRGEHVILSSPLVPDPVSVRYAWADFPEGNLTNASLLPAPSFQS